MGQPCLDSKHADALTAATINLLNPFVGAALTITTDNGKEFAYHEEMTKALGAPVCEFRYA